MEQQSGQAAGIEGQAELDRRYFRQVLGHYPTGVCVVTAMTAAGEPLGMAVGSFASVSNDPPLVAFLPDKSSSTFPKIREAGRFCVNVLSGNQEQICRTFSSRGADRFAGLTWEPAPFSGAPILADSVAWIDCEIDVIHEAGDHYIVLGRVHDLAVENPTLPLLFFQSGYGVFALPSLVLASREGNAEQAWLAHIARDPMEQLSRNTGLECRALAPYGDSLMIVATAGTTAGADPVGGVIPFSPPFGSTLIAWAGDRAVDEWIARYPITAEDIRAGIESDLAQLRRDGWSLASDEKTREGVDLWLKASRWGRTPRLERSLQKLASRTGRLMDPQHLSDETAPGVQLISAPVRGKDGQVTLQLTLYGFPADSTRDSILRAKDLLVRAASQITDAIAEAPPFSR
jgi:flavin reductase (DIM6/NTAB) family NADH-FMN oxidoreductase RutF/DNA-binding IclR family transcriptional regulator